MIEQRQKSTKIEQLWYTWSPIGVGGVTGFRIRAASDGVKDINSERFRSFRPHLGYNLPVGTNLYEAPPETAPLCLAYVDAGSERILVHKVFIGKDAYGRHGVYFIHLVAELPENFSARKAIDLWLSPFWKRSDASQNPPQSVTLPYVSESDLIPGTIKAHDIREVRDYLPFVIQAFLSLEPQQKLYIAAPSDQVAKLVWGLTHSLPASLQKDLTFSTYESDVTKTTARIVGTCRPSTPLEGQDSYSRGQQDLPADCYNRRGLALNCYTGQKSALPQNAPLAAFAQFATDLLIKGNTSTLDNLAKAGRKAQTAIAFLSIYKLSQGIDVTPEDIYSILNDYELAAGLLKEDRVQRIIIELVIAKPQWWEQQGTAAMRKLRAPQPLGVSSDVNLYDTLASFGTTIATEACTAMLRNETAELIFPLLELLADTVPVRYNAEPWIMLLRGLNEGLRVLPKAVYPWELRLWLLQQWAEAAIKDELIEPWLDINWSDLGDLFRVSLPSTWYTRAVMALLTRSASKFPPQIFSWMAEYEKVHDLFVGALQHLIQHTAHPQQRQAALAFFAFGAEEGYSRKLDLLSSLLTAGIRDPKDLDTLLRQARLSTREMKELLERNARQLIPYTAASPVIVEVVKAYITNYLTTGVLLDSHSSAHSLLPLLWEYRDSLQKAGPGLRNWCLAYWGITSIELDEPFLKALGQALQELGLYQEPRYRDKFFFRLVRTIQTEEALHRVVENVGPALIKPREVFLWHLMLYLGPQYQRSWGANFLLPYVRVTLASAAALKGRKQREFLDPVFTTLFKSIDRNIFDFLERHVRQWGPESMALWEEYAVSKRPATLAERVGGAVGGTVGAIEGAGHALGKLVKLPSKQTTKQNTGKHSVVPIPQSTTKQDTEEEPTVSPPSSGIAASQPPQKAPPAMEPDQPVGPLSPSQVPSHAVPPAGSASTSISGPAPQSVLEGVAALINYSGVSREVTVERLKKVYQIKELYTLYRIDELQQAMAEIDKQRSKRSAKKEVLDAQYAVLMQERDLLRGQKDADPQERLRTTRDELVTDDLFWHWPQRAALFNLIQEEFKSKHVRILREFRQFYRKNPNHLLLETKHVTAEDIETTLPIFIRQELIQRRLPELVKPTITWEGFIGELRKQARITYAQSLPPVD